MLLQSTGSRAQLPGTKFLPCHSLVLRVWAIAWPDSAYVLLLSNGTYLMGLLQGLEELVQ